MTTSLPPRGRGTASNPRNRFAPTTSVPVDNDWYDEVPKPQITEIRTERAKSVISRNQSPDLPFDRSINPYRGCEHGWICSVNSAKQNGYAMVPKKNQNGIMLRDANYWRQNYEC